MLFTADLKTFSERLAKKVETEIEVAMKEEDGDQVEKVGTTKTTSKRVKQEPDDGDNLLSEVKEEKMRTVKRRRKA